LVSVTVGATTANINAAMATGGAITGTVTNDAASPVALSGICVSAFPSTGNTFGSTQTDTSGRYSIVGLAGASYTVEFSGCGAANYVTQDYPSPVSVTVGATAANINAALASGGIITGTVTNDAATPVALANICVFAQPPSGNSFGSGQSDATGRYSIVGLAAGTYVVQFSDCGGGGYLGQYYNNQSTFASANLVLVTAGATTANINAALAPGGTITGTVTDNAATPTALANICVSAQPASGSSFGFGQPDA